MRQLVPAAEQLSPTLIAFAKLAPEAKGFFEGLSAVIGKAPTGFPALRRLFRDDFPPLLRAVDPFLRNLNPILTGLNLYKHEVTSLFANLTAATEAKRRRSKTKRRTDSTTCARSGRSTRNRCPPIRAAASTSTATAPTARRSGPKVSPPACPSFNASQCSAGITATLDPNTANNPAFNERTGRRHSKKQKTSSNASRNSPSPDSPAPARYPAPPCTQQEPLDPDLRQRRPATTYQHTFEQTGK